MRVHRHNYFDWYFLILFVNLCTRLDCTFLFSLRRPSTNPRILLTLQYRSFFPFPNIFAWAAASTTNPGGIFSSGSCGLNILRVFAVLLDLLDSWFAHGFFVDLRVCF